jgi:hypothetical protein
MIGLTTALFGATVLSSGSGLAGKVTVNLGYAAADTGTYAILAKQVRRTCGKVFE